jgi:recombination protein RecA
MAHPALARADLEALLRTRKLDRTVQSPDSDGRPAPAPGAGGARLPLGVPLLDARLGGGLPRGQMSEMVGPRSSGRTSLMNAALAAATRRGELTALVDPLDTFDPGSAEAAGVVLGRLLWLRGEGSTMGTVVGRQEQDKLGRVLDRALKAVNLVLQAGGFDLVVLDLADVPASAVGRLPFTTWFRLQRVIEHGRTVCLLLGSAPIARGAEGVSLQCTPARQHRWSPQLFLGLETEVRVVRSRDPEEGRIRTFARQ